MKPMLLLGIAGSLPGLIGVSLSLTGLAGFPWEVPALATAIVIVPAVASLAVMVGLKDRPPEENIAYILGGTFLRMGAALLGGIWAFYAVPAVRENALLFSGWGLTLYLASLVLETVLGLRYNAAAEPKPAGPGL